MRTGTSLGRGKFGTVPMAGGIQGRVSSSESSATMVLGRVGKRVFAWGVVVCEGRRRRGVGPGGGRGF
jgi:hypothetical protein